VVAQTEKATLKHAIRKGDAVSDLANRTIGCNERDDPWTAIDVSIATTIPVTVFPRAPARAFCLVPVERESRIASAVAA
jgi:hypothetical protein